MELRKDPITKSWVLIGDEEAYQPSAQLCPYCPGNEALTSPPICILPVDGQPAGIRVFPHPRPLYQIEGKIERRAEGLYDRMRALGAHEVIVESPNHNSRLSISEEWEIAQLLECWAVRIDDLKRDIRFKYVTIFKNQGEVAGQEIKHPHTELTATPFIPRRILYELRASQEYFGMKERCVMCDIERQEEQQGVRIVDISSSFVALCPFASRVPFELWILPRYHHSSFEADIRRHGNPTELAAMLKRCLVRLEHLTDAYHLVLHTSPNTNARMEVAGYWKTISDDYHWHIEILPITEKKTKSYSIKEVYHCSMSAETAAARLKDLPTSPELVPQRELGFHAR
jgi:UDPglucose--hexose-1-phosphate uridylyltransferase